MAVARREPWRHGRSRLVLDADRPQLPSVPVDPRPRRDRSRRGKPPWKRPKEPRGDSGSADEVRRLMARAFRRLSADEASRALYIDFEGRKDEAPVLLGVLRRRGRGEEPWVQQDIVDPAFAGLGGRALSLHEAVSAVVVRAESRDRRIVSWSEHDLEVVRSLADRDPDLVQRFEARYANALRVARRWRWWLYDGVRPGVRRPRAVSRVHRLPRPAGCRRGQRRRDDPPDPRSAGPRPRADRRPAGPLATAPRPQPPRLRRHEAPVRHGDARARGGGDRLRPDGRATSFKRNRSGSRRPGWQTPPSQTPGGRLRHRGRS